jgi:hypothetical protein
VYDCPKCGTYEITEEARSDLEGIADNPNALEAYRKRIKADNEKNVATVIERESQKKERSRTQVNFHACSDEAKKT